MKEFLYTILGSVIGIVFTWLFNLVSSKMQDKMAIRRLAVQNKLETSKTAMAWLTESKSELSVVIWALEHREKLTTEMTEMIQVHTNRLGELGQEAKESFNAIELYYNLDEVVNKYKLGTLVPQILSLQNYLSEIAKSPSDYSIADYDRTLDELLRLVKTLNDAVSEIMEVIRQDNLSYLK